MPVSVSLSLYSCSPAGLTGHARDHTSGTEETSIAGPELKNFAM